MKGAAAILLGVLALAAVAVAVAYSPTGPLPHAAARPVPPPPGASWQWQLDGRLDLGVRARVYELDGFDTSHAAVARLHRAGRYVVCYVSAGTWEDWRPDRDRFSPHVRGASNGWPGERWLDVRQIDALAAPLRARFAMCARKGFDAVEPDNVDGWANDSGFPLTGRDQLRFNRWLARAAHDAGLAVALKNDLEQARQLEPSFDFAVLEQCFEYHECERARPFLRAGKAVFDAEYALSRADFCDAARRLGVSAIRKRESLLAWREPC